MSREEINDTIVNYLRSYNPEKIGVFAGTPPSPRWIAGTPVAGTPVGSFARGEETETSDLDVLVSFRESFGLLMLVRIERELSELLERKVDLLTEGALKNEKLKKYIFRDLQIIYE